MFSWQAGACKACQTQQLCLLQGSTNLCQTGLSFFFSDFKLAASWISWNHFKDCCGFNKHHFCSLFEQMKRHVLSCQWFWVQVIIRTTTFFSALLPSSSGRTLKTSWCLADEIPDTYLMCHRGGALALQRTSQTFQKGSKTSPALAFPTYVAWWGIELLFHYLSFQNLIIKAKVHWFKWKIQNKAFNSNKSQKV